MSKIGSKIGALAAVVAFVLVGAAGCPGPDDKPGTFLILSIDRPPLAQTLGCPDGQWYMGLLERTIADDKSRSTDDKMKYKKKVCVTPQVAAKYVVNGYYP